MKAGLVLKMRWLRDPNIENPSVSQQVNSHFGELRSRLGLDVGERGGLSKINSSRSGWSARVSEGEEGFAIIPAAGRTLETHDHQT